MREGPGARGALERRRVDVVVLAAGDEAHARQVPVEAVVVVDGLGREPVERAVHGHERVVGAGADELRVRRADERVVRPRGRRPGDAVPVVVRRRNEEPVRAREVDLGRDGMIRRERSARARLRDGIRASTGL